MGYVDLHTHVLPGLDDGAGSFAEAVEILAAARRAGTTAMVATPHMFQPGLGSDDPAAVRQAFARFRERLAAAEAGAVELYLGAENFVGEPLLDAAREDAALTLGGTRALLVEFWPLTTAGAARHAVDSLLAAGYTPVLAHVERYGFLQQEPALLERFVGAGCVAQVNASAVVGHHGLATVQRVDRWLRGGLIAVVASDGHNVSSRPPRLDEAAAALASRHGAAVAELCLSDNPRALLAGLPVTPPPSRPARWWRHG
jgi:protein-tyrosine phosphatase